MDYPAQWIWLTSVLPLLASAVIVALPRGSRQAAAGLAIGSLALSTVLALVALVSVMMSGGVRSVWNFEWFRTGGGPVEIGFVCDPLSAGMLTMVCFVSLLIFIYSVGYMDTDARFDTFFAKLAFFVSAMAGLVVSNSLLLLFVYWELVGLASYLLIGFWFSRPSAEAAAKKAFITTRIGDVGLLLGMVWLYHETGTLVFFSEGQGVLEEANLKLLQGMQSTFFGWSLAGAIGLLLFCGPVGKSGQFPLHVWLPDAMEGPTPVSALIHAATMVAAGVFLMVRLYPMLAGSEVLAIVAWLGAFTALFAALIAVAQNDIKRILAYSTVSQLGFMMLAIGCGNPGAAMLHLLTHAFFKALLFLGAGSVIHGCHEEQDVMRMGGLRRDMPVTWWTYCAGYVALSGVPLTSGFFSKDAVLASVSGAQTVLLPVALAAAFLTAFYMTRQVCLVFFGARRVEEKHGHGGHGHAHAAHESPWLMLVPLIVLSIFCVPVFGSGSGLSAWVVGSHDSHHGGHAVWVMVISGMIALSGIACGWWFYGRTPLRAGDADPVQRLLGIVHIVLRRRFFVDQIYALMLGALLRGMQGIVSVLETLFAAVTDFLGVAGCRAGGMLGMAADERVINPAFDAGCKVADWKGRCVSSMRTGYLAIYTRVAAAGLFALALLYMLWR